MSKNVHIYIFCYNEQFLLPHTVAHYRRLLPFCQFTILDNMSTDNSVTIARQLGCNILQFKTNNQQDEIKHQQLRNDIWKKHNKKWIIMIDMDEWLYINENDLINEDNNGTTILSVKGYNIIGDSKKEDCSDIDLNHLATGVLQGVSKNVCFKSGDIKEINYSVGGHTLNPIGNIKYSNKLYILKHLDYIGLPYKLNKQKIRFARSEKARQMGMDSHYAIPLQAIIDNHDNEFKSAENFYELIKSYL
jgi:hypothetical protein